MNHHATVRSAATTAYESLVVTTSRSTMSDRVIPVMPRFAESHHSPKTRVIYLFPKKEMPMTSN